MRLLCAVALLTPPGLSIGLPSVLVFLGSSVFLGSCLRKYVSLPRTLKVLVFVSHAPTGSPAPIGCSGRSCGAALPAQRELSLQCVWELQVYGWLGTNEQDMGSLEPAVPVTTVSVLAVGFAIGQELSGSSQRTSCLVRSMPKVPLGTGAHRCWCPLPGWDGETRPRVICGAVWGVGKGAIILYLRGENLGDCNYSLLAAGAPMTSLLLLLRLLRTAISAPSLSRLCPCWL